MLDTTLRVSEGPTLVTYDDTDIGRLKGFTDGTADVKLDGLFLVERLVLVDGLKLGTDGVAELGFWNGKMIGTTLGSIPTWYTL